MNIRKTRPSWYPPLALHRSAASCGDYTQQFISTYDEKAKPWAAMLSFIDSHEDTMTLISYLDLMLVKFLQTINLENTIVILSSDNGLHYGPSFFSNGEKKRAEPIFYINIPNSVSRERRVYLTANAYNWVTLLDIHATILDASMQKTSTNKHSTSLLKDLLRTYDNCLT